MGTLLLSTTVPIMLPPLLQGAGAQGAWGAWGIGGTGGTRGTRVLRVQTEE